MVPRTLPGRKTAWSLLASLCLVGATTLDNLAHASGTEQPVPRLEIGVALEVESDTGTRSDDPDEELTDIYNTSEFALGLFLTDAFSIKSGLTFEPVRDPRPGKDRFLTGQGLYVEELYAHYERGAFGFIAGKFNPAFGQAWDKTPGVFGADLAEDYQLTERLGAAATFTTGAGPLGEIEIAAAAFNLDRSNLSSSLFTKRDKAHATDGGPGNADDFSSFSLAFTGAGLGGIDGLGWHLAYRHLARGETNADLNGEAGIAAALFGEYELGEGRSLNWIAEYVHLDGADGAGQKLHYLTFGTGVTVNRLSLAASATLRRSGTPGLPDIRDSLVQLTAGYEVHDGWIAELGWKMTRIEKSDAHTIGFKFSREFNFVVPLR